MKPTSYELLRRTAAKAVETCPGVEAVVLFGSRARGTAHPKSDWDVAVLSRAESAVEQDACRLLGQHERVNAIALKPEAIEEYRDRATRLEAAIARQGRLLAGTWRRPQCRMEHLDTEPDEFREDLEVAIRDIENAVTQLCNAALDDDEYVTSRMRSRSYVTRPWTMTSTSRTWWSFRSRRPKRPRRASSPDTG